MSLAPKSNTYVADNLFYGDFPVTSDEVTVLEGQGVVKRGSVLGIVTATGKAKLVAEAADPADGSEKAKYVLLHDVDTGEGATADDAVAVAAKTGHFNGNALIVAESTEVADHIAELREVGILVNDSRERV